MDEIAIILKGHAKDEIGKRPFFLRTVISYQRPAVQTLLLTPPRRPKNEPKQCSGRRLGRPCVDQGEAATAAKLARSPGGFGRSTGGGLGSRAVRHRRELVRSQGLGFRGWVVGLQRVEIVDDVLEGEGFLFRPFGNAVNLFKGRDPTDHLEHAIGVKC